MGAQENHVFSLALQFGKGHREITPEIVLYGYTKLLLMDEVQVKALLAEEALDDLETAHKWFSDSGLDLKLIKSGLLLLIPLVPDSQEVRKQYQEFAQFLETAEKEISSKEILSRALETAFLPMAELFGTGKSLDAVFSYQKELKDAKSDEDKAVDSSVQKADSKESVTEEKNQNKPEDSSFRRDTDESEDNKDALDLRSLSQRYRELSTSLLDVVKGQEHAVLKFVQGYNQGELLKHVEKKNRPRTYFFFFGPPGVGKTLLAETAAETLGIPYKIFNMSEYVSSSSCDELIGISPIYKNAKEGSLTKFVHENPECLLVFDEIEKANLAVIRLFLQILGSGKLRDVCRDSEVSFRDTTIIFTSNVGSELYKDRSIDLTTLPEKVLVDAIQKEKNAFGEPALPPEICSRIASGNTVMFNHLSIRHLSEMVNSNFEKIMKGIEEGYSVRVTYSKYLPLLFLYNRGGEIDARIAMGQSGRFMKNEIYELMRQMENRREKEQEITAVEFDIDWSEMDEELVRLFKNSDETNVMVFSELGNETLDAMDAEKYGVYMPVTLEDAQKVLKEQDISAVFIDPFYGGGKGDETILSVADYNTDGVRLFHDLVEKNSGLPIFLLEVDRTFSQVDRRTFLLEGAVGTVAVNTKHIASFKRQFEQIMEELYMEKEHRNFCQRGWVIDFNTRQEWTGQNGVVKVLFYALKKRMAVDVESRGSILSDAERPNVRFKDIIGAEKAKEELKYFVQYLQNPKQFLMAGGKPPKGVLLYGPPGTGKTMLAKAMAGESDVTFLKSSAAEFKNKYIGESEANIRRIFQKARKYAPAIIFIDEIDAIGKKRTGGENSSTTESMLNALLTEMDGFSTNESSKPVFVLAATNYGVGAESDGIAALDDALIRRFDNKIYVDLPKESERKEYMMLLLQKKRITSVSEETVQSIAERTTGQSLAILQVVVELAQRNAVKQHRQVDDNDLLTALEEYIHGEKKEHTLDYYKSVAIHECGHAYISYMSGDKPSYITIESRGNFGGYMQHANQEEVTGYTREELLGRIRSALAGRAAEQVFFGKEKALNTGASSDLQHATNLAFRLLCTYGMEEEQLVVLSREEVLRSALAAEYVNRVNELLKNEMHRTIAMVEEAKETIAAIAEELVKENRLTGEQFDALMQKYNK